MNRKLKNAFTLVEMLVTIGLVTILMLAVTQIFSIASKTMGGGQALSAATRDAQAAQAVFYKDFSAVAADGPCFIIRNYRIGGFRNRTDRESNLTPGSPLLYDRDGDGTEETISPLAYNFRNHRQDYMMFFARDKFARQTGNDGTLVSDLSSREAAIYYHHLVLPHTNGTFFQTNAAGAPTGIATNPGDISASGLPASNPQNYYASQWILGRVAMLLIEPTLPALPAPQTLGIRDAGGIPQDYYTTAAAEAPLAWNAPSTAGGTIRLYNSRFDLGGTSIGGYRQILTFVQTTNLPTYDWWGPLMCDQRFQADPFALRPISAANAALQAPIFLPGCTQFMVEFAGDFVEQNPTTGALQDQDGDGSAIGSDGVIDYVPTTRQIRWYGLPRDSNGDGAIRGVDGDVVPVRDVTSVKQSFEKVAPKSNATSPDTTPVPLTTDYYGIANPDPSPGYTVAWGPADLNRPKMIRITLVIDRPEAEGKLPDGQSFEYVFKVGL